jgi:RNA polymerase sigma factor (sigma-70 family)
MLGSAAEADDAVQEAWIRLNRSDTTGIDNLGGWLTTVVARICLSQLQSRRTRREEPLEVAPPVLSPAADPEHEALLADSVGLALLVVLETLTPAERLAFVLHDLFAVPFEEIAPIVDRTPATARQLASRARRRVQGRTAVADPDQRVQREVVEAFLAAARGGDFEALLEVLDPEVVIRTETNGVSRVIRGAVAVASGAVSVSAAAGPVAHLALVNGTVGFVVAPGGRLLRVLCFTIDDHRIREIEVVTEPARLEQLELAVLVA